MNLEEFATRINAELVGKLVNIASRCASFIHRGYGGRLAAQLADPPLYREFVDAGTGIFEAWGSPTARTSTSTATSPGSRRRTRRARPRSRLSAPRASTCSAC